MKPFSVFLMLTVSLCASLCCPEEEEATQFSIEEENLISIENDQTQFAVDDFLVIETIIPNNQTTIDGETILLSDLFYDDVLSESFFQNNLILYLETEFGTRSSLLLTEDVLNASVGTVMVNNEVITVQHSYDAETNSFRSNISIQLKEPGRLFLGGFGFFSQNNGVTISGGIYELGFVTINTTIGNANAEGLYEFMVE